MIGRSHAARTARMCSGVLIRCPAQPAVSAARAIAAMTTGFASGEAGSAWVEATSPPRRDEMTSLDTGDLLKHKPADRIRPHPNPLPAGEQAFCLSPAGRGRPQPGEGRTPSSSLAAY